jgi:hypothetical protein
LFWKLEDLHHTNEEGNKKDEGIRFRIKARREERRPGRSQNDGCAARPEKTAQIGAKQGHQKRLDDKGPVDTPDPWQLHGEATRAGENS